MKNSDYEKYVGYGEMAGSLVDGIIGAIGSALFAKYLAITNFPGSYEIEYL